MGHDVAAVIPIKTNNVRLPGKNTRLLGTKPLYTYMFDTVQRCTDIDKIYIDSSDEQILSYAREYNFNTIKRPVELNSPETSGNDLLEFELETIEEDTIVQLFVTQPFLKHTTIDKAIQLFNDTPSATSVLALFKAYNRYWFEGAPVNHSPYRLYGTQHERPISCEAGFYIFDRTSFLEQKSRVTTLFTTFIADPIECTDIDTETDFRYAEALLDMV